jgi:hypothetical protein
MVLSHNLINSTGQTRDSTEVDYQARTFPSRGLLPEGSPPPVIPRAPKLARSQQCQGRISQEQQWAARGETETLDPYAPTLSTQSSNGWLLTAKGALSFISLFPSFLTILLRRLVAPGRCGRGLGRLSACHASH